MNKPQILREFIFGKPTVQNQIKRQEGSRTASTKPTTNKPTMNELQLFRRLLFGRN